MAKYLNTIKDEVRYLLKDLVGENQEFDDPEIDTHIDQILVEISKACPYEKKETKQTSASSVELDISSIENLIKVEKVEFPTGNNPPDYRNCSVFGDTLRFNYDSSPAAGEDVYLYCWKIHQLTETYSTLKPVLEKVLVDGVVASVAIGWVHKVRGSIMPKLLNTYMASINTKIALYQSELKSITKKRVKYIYPSG